MENVTLYFKQGSSDKVYQAAIEPQAGQFIVTFAYGRRGSTLNTGIKTQSPVSYDEAKKIYDKLIKEKTSKGYTPGEDGTPYQHTDKANQSTGILPQLLNPVDEDEVARLLTNSEYWMQEKFDGRRLLIQKQNGAITGINKLGLVVALPEPLVACMSACPVDCLIDGEAIGDTLYAFDALLVEDDDVRGCRYAERHLRLKNLLGTFAHPQIHLVETAYLIKEKADLFERLRTDGREGAVFKHIDAPYIAGRPNSGGPQRKFKFHETASFVVGKINAKRSVSLLLFDGKSLAAAGNVTIPPNQQIPAQGQIVECRYLYAFRESGCIYQPVFLGPRDDVRPEECTQTQLKFKAEPAQLVA